MHQSFGLPTPNHTLQLWRRYNAGLHALSVITIPDMLVLQLCYIDMLNWSSLEHRRKEAKCIMFYKIINNLVSVDFHHYLQPITSSTRGHHLRYTHLQARVDVFRHSYLPSTIRLWNMLLAQTVSSTSIDIFKDNLANVQ